MAYWDYRAGIRRTRHGDLLCLVFSGIAFLFIFRQKELLAIEVIRE